MSIYLKLDGILGTSKAKGHEHWIELKSVTYGKFGVRFGFPTPGHPFNAGDGRRPTEIDSGKSGELYCRYQMDSEISAIVHAQSFGLQLQGQLDISLSDGTIASYQLNDVHIDGIGEDYGETVLVLDSTLIVKGKVNPGKMGPSKEK